MNFVFISPNYPAGHWKFVSALRNIGANVLCIGDAGDETFPAILRGSMTEYYRVGDLHDYDAVYRACAYYIHRYGRIDCIESLNPYWRDLEAQLRYDYHINGLNSEKLEVLLNNEKALECAENALIKTVPHEKLSSLAAAKRFAVQYGYPIVATPVKNKRLPTFYITGNAQLELMLKGKAKDGYMLSAVPEGEYISCDGIANDNNEAVLCAVTEFVEPPEKIVSENGLLAFWSILNDEKLAVLNNALLKAFDMGNGFFHFSFVRLEHAVEGIGKKGECVFTGAQFNPPAEYVTDAICCGTGTDIYAMWAELKNGTQPEIRTTAEGVVGCAARRFDRSYKNPHEKILRRLGAKLYSHVRTSGVGSEITGDYIYIFKGESKAEIKRYIRFIQEDFASPKIPPKAAPGRAVKKSDAALHKASGITE